MLLMSCRAEELNSRLTPMTTQPLTDQCKKCFEISVTVLFVNKPTLHENQKRLTCYVAKENYLEKHDAVEKSAQFQFSQSNR